MWILEYMEDEITIFHYEETEDEAFEAAYSLGLMDYEVYHEDY